MLHGAHILAWLLHSNISKKGATPKVQFLFLLWWATLIGASQNNNNNNK
jgi:hypothetical protein